MATLSTIQKQIADLEKQAAAIHKTEFSAATAKAKELIAKYQLTAEDLGLGGSAGKKGRTAAAPKRKVIARKNAGVPKFRNPKTGQTWTGNGKAPGWIAGAKNRDKFLIDAPAAVAASAAATQAAPKKRAAKKTIAAVAKVAVVKASAVKEVKSSKSVKAVKSVKSVKAAKTAATVVAAAPAVKKTRAKKAPRSFPAAVAEAAAPVAA